MKKFLFNIVLPTIVGSIFSLFLILVIWGIVLVISNWGLFNILVGILSLYLFWLIGNILICWLKEKLDV